MAILIFTFSINPETKEATFAGNISLQEALPILQSLAIAEAVQRAAKKKNKPQKAAKEK